MVIYFMGVYFRIRDGLDVMLVYNLRKLYVDYFLNVRVIVIFRS